MAKEISKVQASEVKYELHSLGWKAFQDLCSTIIAELFGQSIQVFLPSHDGGRDGAFRGQWNNIREGGVEGSYAVQCKYSSKSDSMLKLTSISDEIEKSKRLAAQGFADNYILMTNQGLTGTEDEKINKVFYDIPGIKWFTIFDSTWLTLRIKENSRLRMLVPRIYGLGDLSQILDERAYSQAQEIIKSMGPELKKFVITEAHRRSAKALQEPGFVMLLGEPASGKSMIATTLALGAIDIWNCSTIKIIKAEEFIEHWNPNEPKQFFWVDDVFGTTQYQKEYSFEWNKAFPHLYAAIKKGAKILFTSRDYIYRNALSDLKISSFPLIEDSQVVINVQDLTIQEKEQILYNHLKLGDQPKHFKTKIKPYLVKIAESKRFLPEIARRIGTEFFTKQLDISQDSIMHFVEQPLAFLIDIVRSLKSDAKAALSLLFMRGSILDSPMQLRPEEIESLNRLNSSLAGIGKELNAMDGSLVLHVRAANNYWRFKHPTISEAIGEIIADDPELMDIYIYGTPAQKLIKEITCGDVSLPGVKLIIPETRYDIIINKLSLLEDESDLHFFLAFRCSLNFLKSYLYKNPNILDRISKPLSYFNVFSPKVFLLTKLYEYGLLPEDHRKRFVATISDLAVEIPDASFLKYGRIRSLFTTDEIESTILRVKEELLPSLSDYIHDWRWNYNKEDDPENYFEPFIESLSILSNELSNDEKSINMINEALNEINNEIEYLKNEFHEEYYYGYDNLSSESKLSTAMQAERSIFDDVDE
jgi:hypothetical protein